MTRDPRMELGMVRARLQLLDVHERMAPGSTTPAERRALEERIDALAHEIGGYPEARLPYRDDTEDE